MNSAAPTTAPAAPEATPGSTCRHPSGCRETGSGAAWVSPFLSPRHLYKRHKHAQNILWVSRVPPFLKTIPKKVGIEVCKETMGKPRHPRHPSSVHSPEALAV